MDNISYSGEAMESAGLPYDNINWYNIEGQPFGLASRFNVIVFNNANNIIDIEGPVAIGGSFYSPRGLSVGFPRSSSNRRNDYSPDLVRFLVGGNVSMTGPLVVIGHVVVGGGFHAAKGSTYLIGKDSTTDGMNELKYLYQANGGSQYWTPTDKGDHYLVSSYDVPRFIPARRIGANLPRFFNDARESIGNYKNCIESLTPNGRVVDNNYEWILRGDDPVQNIFLIDVRPNGLINKGIRAEVPQGSTVIVRLRTGANAHLQYGVYGESSKANETLYVFEDASNIYMEKSSDIWGSILAPQAMFHAHSTGGHVSGNAALGDFAVNASSGFEFHYYPFVGGVICQAVAPTPVRPAPVTPTPVAPTPVRPAPVAPTPVRPAPVTPTPVTPTPVRPAPVAPTPVVPPKLPEREEQPIPACPVCPTCPPATPCPTPEPCPVCPQPTPCPTPEPCPVCPQPTPCPTPEPCPVCPACPQPTPCPTPKPCPVCPACPQPTPCPIPEPCPVCPVCPKPTPCPTPKPCPACPKPMPCPTPKPCPICQECLIEPGIIRGCILGCCCGIVHEWEVELYKRGNDFKTFLFCVQIDDCGYFEFEVPYEGCYILKVRPSVNCRKTNRCRPIVIMKNIGVANFMID